MVERRLGRGGLLLEGGVIAVAATAALIPISSDLVEQWYSTGVYPYVERVLTPVSNLAPVAWLDVLGCAVVIALLRAWTRVIRHAWRERRLPPVGRALVHTIAAAAALYLVFLILWGFNYRRVPMTRRLALDGGAPASAAVVKLGRDAAMRLNGLHTPAHAAGWREPVWRNEPLQRAFLDVQRELADARPVVPGRLKRSVFGRFFRWTAVDGMVNPFGLEVVVNPDLLTFERPFVAAHEWAHLAGYADESEANFVGWLTCVRADVPAQYSGWLYLYWQIAGELGDRDRRAMAETLAEGPRSDLRAIAARLRRGDFPLLRHASWVVYDQYLKANRVESGVRSYGAVVTLILRARFEDGWRPVRRGSVAPGV